MKIKISNGEALQSLYPALLDLRKLTASVRIQYNCLKSLKEVESSIKIIEEERKKILEEGALKEDGKPKIDKNEYVFETPEKKQEVVSKINELYSIETEIEIWSLPLSEVENLDMTGELLKNLIGKFFTEPA